MADCLHPEDCRASRSCYTGRGCRGDHCMEAMRVHERQRARVRRRPDVVRRAPRVPTGQVRTHLEELRAAGIGYTRVAQLAGVKPETVRLILIGARASTSPETKEKILAVMPSMLAPHTLVDAARTHERLDVLLELGWSELELARVALGPHVRPAQGAYELGRLHSRALVTRRVEDAVRHLYDDEVPGEINDGDPLAEFRLLAEPMPWRADAECRRLDPDPRARQAPFFPTRGEPATLARECCERCPVAEPCLDFALATNAQGIWGATTGGERRLIRRLGWGGAEVLALAGSAPAVSLVALLEVEVERVARAS